MNAVRPARAVLCGVVGLTVIVLALIANPPAERTSASPRTAPVQQDPSGSQAAAPPAPKKPLPRSESFFGLHFDLHPSRTDTSLGADISEENIRDLLRRVRPDYVQYDCKGHAGYTGYPTEVGWASPGIVKDSLAVWRKLTRDEGVGLYIHYSGVWDSKAVEMHPEWARIDAAGKRDPNATSVFGPYVDELLIPQLKEVTSKYDLDGVWADGECWAAQLDYSAAALAAWRKETGDEDAPRSPNDPRWLAWKMFNRRAFEAYLVHWIDALHAFRPSLQLTSNWMYTSFAPKPVTAKLDFLSGDYSPGLSVDRARLEARYLASTGMPWDLMAWGFDKGKDLGWTLKTAEHLQQEAAVVLMQGGGFQIYHQPTRSGYLVEPIIAQEEAVAKFCRARQDVSQKSTTVPQVALLLSSETTWQKAETVYSPSADVLTDVEGALHALLNLHYSVDVLAEHQLEPRLAEYPLVVVPDAFKLTPEFRRALTAYIEGGGKLLLLGEKCARLFEPILGVEFVGAPESREGELASLSGMTNAAGVWQKVKLTTALAAGFIHSTRDTRKGAEVAATVNVHGKGKVAAVYGPVASIYFRSHHPWLREFVDQVVKELFVPAVRFEGPPTVDVSLRRTKDGRLSVHLLNTTGMPLPDRYNFTDFIPPVDHVRVTVRCPKPRTVILAPDGGKLDWRWRDGWLWVNVPRLHIHGVVVID